MEKTIIHRISQADKIVITAHKSPDGDSVGSSLALFHICKNLGKKAVVCFPDELPSFLTWLHGTSEIITFSQEPDKVTQIIADADLLFALDYNDTLRLGFDMAAVFEESKAYKIMIDHHTMPKNFVDLTYSFPKVCSTSQLIYQVLENSERLDLLTVEVGTPIYTGILTDTGSFRFPSVTAKTHLIIAKLLEIGVAHFKIHENVWDINTPNRLRLRGFVLSEKLEIISPEIAIVSLTKSEAERFEMEKGDTEGLVNEALSIQGTKIAAFFKEEDGFVKISFRSKGINNKMNLLSKKYFNGGGHINAAGGSFRGNIVEAIALFKEKVYEFLDKE